MRAIREQINYNIIVGVIGVAIVIYMVGAIILAMYDKTLPQELSYVAIALGGALTGMLVPTPATQDK